MNDSTDFVSAAARRAADRTRGSRPDLPGWRVSRAMSGGRCMLPGVLLFVLVFGALALHIFLAMIDDSAEA